ncbi:MAG: inositol monophosphatase [Deltaproteobacteria bacterium]|nr:inositol monophosphatase [Deltaproteobacteria bacterium]
MKRMAACLAPGADDPLAGILRTAVEAALDAGHILAGLYHQPHQIRYKGEIDLVTEADVASERCILDMLAARHPASMILSEESHAVYGDVPQQPVWIIDPLDGTTNFAHGFPWFAVSIAYAEKGKSQVGVIYAPLQDELFIACRDHGAWLNGEKIAVSASDKLLTSLLATGFPYDIKEKSDEVLSALRKFLGNCQGVRRAGAAALDLACVACGRLEGFWEIHLKPWDTAAGLLLVEEAGGKVTDFRGQTYTPFVPEIAASNGLIHDELITRLQEFSVSRSLSHG